jgi:hypothetical protein
MRRISLKRMLECGQSFRRLHGPRRPARLKPSPDLDIAALIAKLDRKSTCIQSWGALRPLEMLAVRRTLHHHARPRWSSPAERDKIAAEERRKSELPRPSLGREINRSAT